MGKKPMAPMAVSERAKQFMPFKAVAGLDEALERKRIEMGVAEVNPKEKKDAHFMDIFKEF